jgi:hypothetical protein
MQRPDPPGWGFGVGLKTLPCKKKIVENPPRNSAGFCGGVQGLSWAVEPRKEEEEEEEEEDDDDDDDWFAMGHIIMSIWLNIYIQSYPCA